MNKEYDLRTFEWSERESTIEWPREAQFGSVLIANHEEGTTAYLIADATPIAAYSLCSEDLASFHASVAKYWYEHDREGSFTVTTGLRSKGGIPRPLPPPPPLPIGHPRTALSQAAQLSHAMASQVDSTLAVIAKAIER